MTDDASCIISHSKKVAYLLRFQQKKSQVIIRHRFFSSKLFFIMPNYSNFLILWLDLDPRGPGREPRRWPLLEELGTYLVATLQAS